MDRPSRRLPSHPPAGADAGGSAGIGRPVARLEAERFLRGGSRYVSDLIAASDALRVKVLRSPHAHARLLAVDATAARALPGVVAVLTADDLAGVADLPCDWMAPGMEVVPQHPVLARDRVRYVGEPIAAAATAHAAEDALGAIAVAYEKLPAAADQEAAMEEGAARIHDAVPSNIGYRYRRTVGDIARAFAEAEVVVRRRLTNNRVTAAPLAGAGAHGAFRWREAETALASAFVADGLRGVRLSPDGLAEDLFADAAYRAHLTEVLARRAVALAAGPAPGVMVLSHGSP